MIKVIITGGTIDSFFDEKQGKLSPNRHSAVMASMKDVFLDYMFRFEVLCLKNSRDISARELEKLITVIENSKDSDILVVHGYETMADSMDIVAHALNKPEKKVIFVGSRFPLSVNKKEAHVQIKIALENFAELDYGVFASIDGEVLHSTEVRNLWYEGKLQSEWVV